MLFLLLGSASAHVSAQVRTDTLRGSGTEPTSDYFRLVDRYRTMGYDFAAITKGDGATLLDTTTIERHGSTNRVTAWVLAVKERPKADAGSGGALYSANKVHAEFDCARGRWRWTYFDFETADRVVYVETSPTPWMDVPPGSHADNALLLACLRDALGKRHRR